MSSRTVSYRSSAVSMSASLSKAIRDERYEDLRELLKKPDLPNGATNLPTIGKARHNRQRTNDHPLWERNSRGWTPMHVAAIASATMPIEWWTWILQQLHNDSAESSVMKEDGSDLWRRQTDQGQTVVGLFFRTALDPLPWCKHSLKEKASKLRAAIEQILTENRKGNDNLDNDRKETKKQYTANEEHRSIENYGMLEKLRELILVADFKHGKENNSVDDQDNSDVAIVFRFWNKLTALFSTPTSQHNLRHSIVNILAGLPWCPELVARLAIALFPVQVEGNETTTDRGDDTECSPLLPLHRCIRSFGGSGGGVGCVPRGMLQVLCDAYPSAASIPDPASNGRLPLHVALASGPQHSWEKSLCHLFASHPSSVAVDDPVTGLPAFCMACDAIAPIQEYQIEQTAKNMGNRSLCWYYLSKTERTRAMEEALVFLQCQKLTAMYEVLRRDPSVLDLQCTDTIRAESQNFDENR